MDIISKKTFTVKRAKFWDLTNKLQGKFGFPFLKEELAIYVDDSRDSRITITREKMRVSWKVDDSSPEKLKFHVRKHKIDLDTENIKSKLIYVLGDENQKCTISRVTVLEFSQGDVYLSLIRRSLVGPIITIEVRAGAEIDKTSIDKAAEYEAFIGGFIDYDLPDRVAALPEHSEACFFDTGKTLLLNDKIMDFCRSNGIINIAGSPRTYEEVQKSKSNDYSSRQQVFEKVFATRMLSQESISIDQITVSDSLSVIIPYYNSSESIKRVVGGILGQRGIEKFRSHLEVIIVDDGSSHSASEVLKEWDCGLDIKVIRLDDNGGASLARRIGMARARGDILIFIDSDIILSETYILDHYVRNSAIDDALFVSFKKNVGRNFYENAEIGSAIQLACPDLDRDLRFEKVVSPSSIGVYDVHEEKLVNILEETNFFKDFHGSRVFGVYDLASMIIGHNFTGRRKTFEKLNAFTPKFKGWGLEDTYLGLRALASGMFVIPVLSCGVYHLEHLPRSGDEETKQAEYKRNAKMLKELMRAPASRLL